MKKCLLIIPLLLFSISLVATPIGEKRAREIATNFFATATRSGAAPSLDLAWVGNDMEQNLLNNATRSAQAGTSDDALLYIYNRTDSDGFVIVAGDDNAKRGIIAYSYDNSFDTENMAEGAKAMLQAWCKDISEARNSKSAATRAIIIIDKGNAILEYETAKWAQGSPYNNECPTINGKRTVTGCVATAAAIICHYHKWPERAVGETKEYTISEDNTTITVPAKTLGRTYDYDNMLLSYKNVSYTDEQAAAVAALMSDIGCAISIQYGSDETGGNILRLAKELALKFGYSKEMLYLRRVSYDDSKWYEMLKRNLDTYGPTYYRGETAGGSGHAFLLDGYSDTDYFRINYGHAGKSDGYYFLPYITYFNDQRAIFNMYPDRDGTTQYKSCMTLEQGSTTFKGLHTNATKYEVGKPFTCYIRIRNRGLVSFGGWYAVAHCDKEDNIKSILATEDRTSNLLGSEKYTTKSLTATITKPLEAGDCLRVVYKAANESEWKFAKRIDENSIDRVVMCVSAEDIAKNMVLEYDKTTKVLSISSPYAMQCSITDVSGRVVASSETKVDEIATFSLATLNANIYNCSFSASGKPYTIKLKLHDQQSNGSFGLDGLGGYVDDTIF